MRNKKFECEKECDLYLDMVVFGCTKCIKKIAPALTKEQKKELSLLLHVAYAGKK